MTEWQEDRNTWVEDNDPTRIVGMFVLQAGTNGRGNRQTAIVGLDSMGMVCAVHDVDPFDRMPEWARFGYNGPVVNVSAKEFNRYTAMIERHNGRWAYVSIDDETLGLIWGRFWTKRAAKAAAQRDVCRDFGQVVDLNRVSMMAGHSNRVVI